MVEIVACSIGSVVIGIAYFIVWNNYWTGMSPIYRVKINIIKDSDGSMSVNYEFKEKVLFKWKDTDITIFIKRYGQRIKNVQSLVKDILESSDKNSAMISIEWR